MRTKKKVTLTQEEMNELFSEGGCEISRSAELLSVYYKYVDQSEHVFAFNMYYADPEKGMYGSDLVREFGPEILDKPLQQEISNV